MPTKKPKKPPTEPARAYAAIWHGGEPKPWIIGLCVAGAGGYHVVADYGPYSDEARAKEVAELLNARVGITAAQARMTAFASMPRTSTPDESMETRRRRRGAAYVKGLKRKAAR